MFTKVLKKKTRDAGIWKLFEHVEVDAKKKKRSRCRLCGEQWWDIGPSFTLEHMGFNPGREVQRKYGKCAKINDPENSGRSGAMFHADTMRVNDAKKAAKLQGGITQQSAEDATFQQNGVDVESARSAGFIPPVNSALVRAFANHKPLAQKETIAPEGGPSALKVGPSTLVQASPTMLSTVSLSVRKQLDDKWAAAFYECGIPFEVASSEALRDTVEDTARLVRMPDYRFALVLKGLGAGKVGARRLHEPTPEETRWRSPRRCGLARARQPQRCAAPAR